MKLVHELPRDAILTRIKVYSVKATTGPLTSKELTFDSLVLAFSMQGAIEKAKQYLSVERPDTALSEWSFEAEAGPILI